ncbi:MAG TPA: aspartate carbamoyltransferase regulatory subunit [Candidatus Excrementavichristensenella intestinipullorum]|nr:aspartate carbamoyltransferase regulatory subunit [Candidatus Excrementavichristensenella intestinipullorum]
MNIDSIRTGIVLDHIPAGRGMEIYKYLKLGKLDCSVAIIKNAKSKKLGRKDIIKIDEDLDVDLDALAYIDPGITINVIKDGKLVEKRDLALPQRIVNILKCKNPRCITSVEPGLDQVFLLSNPEKRAYRCAYCEEEMSDSAL